MFDSKLLEKAKAAKSVAELLDIAKENNIELSEEQAKTYFAQLSPNNGELSDEELDNVSGGGCHAADGRLVVTVGYYCEHFGCKVCGGDGTTVRGGGGSEPGLVVCAHCGDIGVCCNYCRYCSFEGGAWLCNNPKNRQ